MFHSLRGWGGDKKSLDPVLRGEVPNVLDLRFSHFLAPLLVISNQSLIYDFFFYSLHLFSFKNILIKSNLTSI